MRIEFTSHAHRQYKKLPPSLETIIKDKISELSTTPYPHGYKKLAGRNNGYHLRCGDYRIIYYYEDQKKPIYILSIAHRREVYKIWQFVTACYTTPQYVQVKDIYNLASYPPYIRGGDAFGIKNSTISQFPLPRHQAGFL